MDHDHPGQPLGIGLRQGVGDRREIVEARHAGFGKLGRIDENSQRRTAHLSPVQQSEIVQSLDSEAEPGEQVLAPSRSERLALLRRLLPFRPLLGVDAEGELEEAIVPSAPCSAIRIKPHSDPSGGLNLPTQFAEEA